MRFQNEEGPVRLKVQKKQKEIANLKAMLKDKMILNDQEINDILDSDELDYRDKISKALRRAQVFKNDFEWLKPYCLDKWRGYIAERKAFAYHFKKTNKYLNKSKSPLANAFDQWSYATRKQQELLYAKTQQELFDRTNDNQLKLFKQADEVDYFQEQIGDLKHQREYLIEKVVLSQRLALARCRFSYKYALEQAWVRLNWNSNLTMKVQFDKSLTGNLGTINELKEKMVTLQQENEEIAEQNEGLQEGAMEGVDSLNEMEEQQKEVETLNK